MNLKSKIVLGLIILALVMVSWKICIPGTPVCFYRVTHADNSGYTWGVTWKGKNVFSYSYSDYPKDE